MKPLNAMLAGAAAMLLLLVLVAALVIWSGVYNVGASSGHSPLGRLIFSTTMERSVEAHAEGDAPRFTAAMVRAGGAEYKEMCQQCHGGPGASRDEWARGMTPLPPDLSKEAREWTPEEVHWIVTHGIKMSGMPAFGATHDQQTIWNIAAFVKQLPGMTAETYAAIPSEEESGHRAGEGGHHH